MKERKINFCPISPTMQKMKKLGSNQIIYYFLFLKIEIKKVRIFKKQLKIFKMMKTINLFTH